MINIDIRKHEKLSNGEYSAFITFSYSADIVNKIRSYPFRYYNPEMRSWEIPVENVTDFINSFQDTDIKITGEISQLNEKEVNTDIPEGFHFKTKPFEHQEKGLEYGLKYDRWFLGDEQGLGKTKQIIDIAVARKIKYNYKHCLIVCGVNTLKWNWANEIHTHSDEECWILGQRNQKIRSIVIGSMTDKLNDLTDIDELPYFIITNIESFRNENFVEKIVKLCKNDKINMCAVDEVHKCFDYDTLIKTDEGDIKIGDIVTNKLNVKVASFNEDTKKLEYKPILNYFKNLVNKPLLELTFEIDGEIKTIKCTDDHLFFTKNRGWITAKQLDSNDELVTF